MGAVKSASLAAKALSFPLWGERYNVQPSLVLPPMSIGRAGISSRLHRRRPACRSGRLPRRTGPHPPQAGGRRQLAPHDARALTEDHTHPTNPACATYPLTVGNSSATTPPPPINH